LDTSECRWRYTWNVSKCGAGGKWRISVGEIVGEIKMCYREERRQEYSANLKRMKANWT
jgi:hypothetical protein